MLPIGRVGWPRAFGRCCGARKESCVRRVLRSGRGPFWDREQVGEVGDIDGLNSTLCHIDQAVLEPRGGSVRGEAENPASDRKEDNGDRKAEAKNKLPPHSEADTTSAR